MPRLYRWEEKAKFNRGEMIASVALYGWGPAWGHLKSGIPVIKKIEVGRDGKVMTAADYGEEALMWSEFIRCGTDEGWETYILATEDWFKQQAAQGRVRNAGH